MSSVADLCARLVTGDRRALARLLTIVEDGSETERREVITILYRTSPRARVLGITGAPGVGKSSVTNALITALRSRGRRVGVLAVDPSSPYSGGALLGDRVRMQSHHDDEQVFVRSMAARSRLGGIAAAVPEAVLVLAAGGYDDVIIETVGVGQSEIDVAALADTTVLVMAPGMGDAVQAAKAGILEVADVFVVNKADQPGAGMLESELRTMLEVGHATLGVRTAPAGADADRAWVPPILRTVAVRGEGVEELLSAADEHGRTGSDALIGDAGGPIAASTASTPRELRRAHRWIEELTLSVLRARLESSGQLAQLAAAVAQRTIDPLRASELLLAELERPKDDES